MKTGAGELWSETDTHLEMDQRRVSRIVNQNGFHENGSNRQHRKLFEPSSFTNSHFSVDFPRFPLFLSPDWRIVSSVRSKSQQLLYLAAETFLKSVPLILKLQQRNTAAILFRELNFNIRYFLIVGVVEDSMLCFADRNFRNSLKQYEQKDVVSTSCMDMMPD
ncbi:hypothetical protein CEXT_84901 [Caerostris extrusa]|uniref:Maturase K n=1 Tax=Caerostris extrusa TaxID=172846 RepID=A0AAV4NDJ9_CAEEX|nr:hypothetical protein CEXT_84901 [Caerostris extrusa]